MPAERKALAIGLLSYTAWGLFPIFWRLLREVGAAELLAQRFIWSFVFYLAVFLWFYRRHPRPLKRPTLREWGAAALAASLLGVNWGIFIYAVNTGRVLESSLAYFLNPLLNVGVGVLFFREQFPWALRIAVLLAAIGVATQFVGATGVPWIAVTLATTFCAYGIVKKLMPVEATLGSLMEGAVGVLPALVAAVILRQESSLPHLDTRHWVLLVSSGAVTGLPLVMFAYAAQRLPYSLLGVIQFVAPTLQFLVGWLLFSEVLDGSRLIAFSLVWAGIGFYLLDRVLRLRPVWAERVG
jgi:chloramphenicol-sensitive protein RarD